MSLVIDTLNSASFSEELKNSEIENIDELFDVQDYKSGMVIAQVEDKQPENLGILAHGMIKVKAQNSVGETTIHIFKPGDILQPDDRPAMPTFDKGTSSQTHTTLYAVGDTKVINLDRVKLENMAKFHPKIMYHAIQSMVRSVNDVMQRMNHQNEELRNYIYGVDGRH